MLGDKPYAPRADVPRLTAGDPLGASEHLGMFALRAARALDQLLLLLLSSFPVRRVPFYLRSHILSVRSSAPSFTATPSWRTRAARPSKRVTPQYGGQSSEVSDRDPTGKLCIFWPYQLRVLANCADGMPMMSGLWEGRRNTLHHRMPFATSIHYLCGRVRFTPARMRDNNPYHLDRYGTKTMFSICPRGCRYMRASRRFTVYVTLGPWVPLHTFSLHKVTTSMDS